jgi:hypothetical protein
MTVYTAYQYDLTTYIFMRESTYDPANGSLAPGWTLVEPPISGQYQANKFNPNTQRWALVADYIGVTFYTADGYIAPAITDYGVSPDSTWSITPTLLYTQRQKEIELITHADAILTSGLVSSVTGAAYTYAFSENSAFQLGVVFGSAQTNGSTEGWSAHLTCKDANNHYCSIQHTASQIGTIYAGYSTSVENTQQTLASLLAQVAAITDTTSTGIAAVQAIVWS